MQVDGPVQRARLDADLVRRLCDRRAGLGADGVIRVVRTARLDGLPKKDGARRVCVRVVDVFGFEAEATVEVA